jgi:hypothetical protein
VRLEMAGEARVRRLARVDDELLPALPARLDVLAPRPVARFAAGLARQARAVRVEAPVRAGGEGARVVRVAVGARGVAHERRALDLRRRGHGALDRRARTQRQAAARHEEAQGRREPGEETAACGGHAPERAAAVRNYNGKPVSGR